MPDDPDPTPPEGFVAFPAWMIDHPQLKDGEIRMLLALDQIGWREGKRDGVVEATNAEIGRRLGKSAWTVRAGLKRIEAVEPPLVAVEMHSGTRRDSITLLYDRYGNARVNGSAAGIVAVVSRKATASEIPLAVHPTATTPTPIATAGQAEASGSEISLPACASEIATHSPLVDRETCTRPQWGASASEIPLAVHPVAPTGEVPPTAPTLPSEPRTFAELIAWLPSVTDDERDRGRYEKKVPQWVARLMGRHGKPEPVAVEWVVDAIIKASDKDDPVAYAEGVLAKWAAQGGRRGIEIPDPGLAMPDETDHGTPVVYGPVMPKAAGPPPGRRETKADRDAERARTRRENLMRMFPAPAKEDDRGEG